jgi:hypothetical protein
MNAFKPVPKHLQFHFVFYYLGNETFEALEVLLTNFVTTG